MSDFPYQATLLSAAAATGPGDWVSVGSYDTLVLLVEGMVTNDIIQIEGALVDGDAVVPTAAQIGQIGTDITADGFYEPSAVPMLVRANFTDNTGGGTPTVTLLARRT